MRFFRLRPLEGGVALLAVGVVRGFRAVEQAVEGDDLNLVEVAEVGGVVIWQAIKSCGNYSAIATATSGAFWPTDRQNWYMHMSNWLHWALTHLP